ncbi:MAG: outer membrane protein transport protein [Ignavibacteriales bacterium]|nr:outer membrane protein transport protein [Ignavibacteriales bacterium]
MKTFRKTYWLVILMIIGLQIQPVNAQFAEDALRYSQLGLGVSARQLGMGNATVGGVDDYSALFWNPAGLALERDFEFSFGLSSLGYSNDVSYIGTKTSSNNSVVNLNNLGLVYPIPTVRGSLTFAFGFYRAANYTTTASMSTFNPYSSYSQSIYLLEKPLAYNIPYKLFLANADTLGNVIPILNGNVQQAINVIEGGGLNHWTFGGAIDVGPNLSVGISLNYAGGSYSYDQTVNESDTKNYYPVSISPEDFNQFSYESTVNDDIKGFNALFGLMFRKTGKYSIGFAIRTSTTYNISETYTEAASSQFKTKDVNGFSAYSYPLTSNSIKYEVTTPYILSGGVSVQPLEWLLLAGDVEYTDWTQMDLSADGVDFSTQNSRIKNELRATTNLRGGGEVSLRNLGLKLRGGIIYNPSPWKGDPTSRNQMYYTAGIGYMLDERTSIDAGYAYGTWKSLRNNYSYSASGYTYDEGTDETVTTSNLNLTLLYRF